MPMPCAAFSPLTITKSGASSSRRPGSSSRRTRRPARPTTSPMKRMREMPRSYRRGMSQEDPPPPLEAPPPVPPARVEPVLVPRWVQLVLLPVAIAGAYLVLAKAVHVRLLFTIAGLIALFLNPLVTLVQRARIPRGAAVAIVMVSVVGFAVGLGFLLADPVSNQASSLQRE